MAAVVPPAKPPRGVKHAKETSGLLMSVIRTLSASESNEQRDREKAKLEKEYKRSDQRLDELVSIHDQNLTQVMQLFGKLSARVTASREKIHAVKENLQACKMLLRCRRDELKKLWLEGIEHKHVLQLLEQIDQLREVPGKLGGYLSKKHYLHATQLLVSAHALGEGSLEGVDALREVRVELQAKKEQLHLKLMEELTKHLYVHSTQDVLLLHRQGSGRDNMLLPFQRGGLGDIRGSGRGRQDQGKVRRAHLDVGSTYTNQSPRTGLSPGMSQSMTGSMIQSTVDDSDNIQEDTDAADPEENSEHFMAILVECLALLNKVPDAVETIKVQMQNELLAIIKRTAQQILDFGTVPQDQNQSKLLLDLLQTVFEQFRLVVAAHASVLKSFKRVSENYKIDVHLYDMADVWSKVQAVLQLLLTDYLDIQNATGSQHQAPSSFSEPTSDISAFFARRKPPRAKRTPLFRFDYSSHALSINNYLKEQRRENAGNQDAMDRTRSQHVRLLVCQPDPRNITLIFIPLMKFIEEIEKALGCTPGNPCTLNAFLSDYIKEVFLGRHHVLVSGNIEAATKSLDAWRATTNQDAIRGLGVSRPLLQSTVSVERCIQDLRDLMQALPAYAEHFLSMICNILQNYRETCQAAYRGIVQPDSEDKRIISAMWAKDEDISRFLKSLPNWSNLQAEKVQHLSGQDEGVEEEESPEEVRQRNVREAEILAGNLGDSEISIHEILSDVGQLRGLAQLQESMEWFASSIMSFATSLPRLSPSSPSVQMSSEGVPAMPDSAVEALVQLGREFEDLADTCLLVLHLEVRVHCFHYLLPRGNHNRFSPGGDTQEPDPKVIELSRDLISIDEAMNSSLQPRKSKYIFEGLGHLIAKILISSAQYIERVNEHGIQKMCRNIFALQQTLTNITMAREVALDHARHYFELFYLSSEEILSIVLEKGPQFSELEYMNAFQLLNRSQSDPDHGAINMHLQRLSEILGEVGVTV